MRGAHPSLKNFCFMRRLRLRTLISLMPEPPSSDIDQFCSAENISLKYHRVDKYDEGDVLSMSAPLVASLLTVLIDPANHPVFVHCRDGGHNTGLLVMCLRRLQYWTTAFIHDEHRRYTKGNEIHYQEEQFVEGFSGPVVVPAMVPKWLWGGCRIAAHPLIQIQHVTYDSEESTAAGEDSLREHAIAADSLQTSEDGQDSRASEGVAEQKPSIPLAASERSSEKSWYDFLLEPPWTLKKLAARPVASSTAPYSLDLDGLSLAGLDLAKASSDEPRHRRKKPFEASFTIQNSNGRQIARQQSTPNAQTRW